ncbi:Polyamine-Transporting Atpase 13A2 [Manis pentadactyla]|nr:Polyamine-Transporting Atpase 13A2 [Manis pentadactyla]
MEDEKMPCSDKAVARHGISVQDACHTGEVVSIPAAIYQNGYITYANYGGVEPPLLLSPDYQLSARDEFAKVMFLEAEMVVGYRALTTNRAGSPRRAETTSFCQRPRACSSPYEPNRCCIIIKKKVQPELKGFD